MLVTCERFGDLFLFGLIWHYSSNQKILVCCIFDSYGCLPTKGIVAVCPIVMIDLTDTGKNKKKNLSQYQKEELAAITIELLIAVLQLIQPED